MKKIVGSMSEWSGVLKDLFRQINDGSISLDQMQSFLEHRNPFEPGASENYADLINDWQKFYLDVFGMETDFSNLQIPKKQKGFDRLIIVAQGITPQKLYDKCAELFFTRNWMSGDLNKIVISDRTAENGSYAIWVRDRVEADKELKNLSADQLKEKNISGITLEERLLYELKFFKETGKHLDIDNVTLCSGSRYGDGRVPSGHWIDDKMRVSWSHADRASGHLRSRQVVS
jgi:hypothetical protein